MIDADHRALVWLSMAEISPYRVQKLLEICKEPRRIWDDFGKKGGPSFSENASLILRKNHDVDKIDQYLDKLNQNKVQLLFRDDPHFPEYLAWMEGPPYLLYYAGQLEFLPVSNIAIVGTRRATAYGIEMAQKLAHDLTEAGLGVISGMARGIDSAAHRSAIEAGGYTVGVLGSGINVPYPPENRGLLREIADGHGVIISEYPLDAPPAAYHFPNRNRIISGLSRGVVLVEGQLKSGGMITINQAIDQGREIFAVPGPVGWPMSEGPNQIIKEYGHLITCAQDILDCLNIQSNMSVQKNGKKPADMSDLDEQICALLFPEPLTTDEISERISMDPGDLDIQLTTMEITGLIAREPGNRFRSLV